MYYRLEKERIVTLIKNTRSASFTGFDQPEKRGNLKATEGAGVAYFSKN